MREDNMRGVCVSVPFEDDIDRIKKIAELEFELHRANIQVSVRINHQYKYVWYSYYKR